MPYSVSRQMALFLAGFMPYDLSSMLYFWVELRLSLLHVHACGRVAKVC